MQGLSLIILKTTLNFPYTKQQHTFYIIMNIYIIIDNVKAMQEMIHFRHFTALPFTGI